MRLLKPLERQLDRWVDKSLADERVYVENPARLRFLFWRGALGFLVGLAAIVGASWFPDDSLARSLCIVTLGFMVGGGALRSLVRARAYRNGYLAGRMAMIHALQESANRGMSLEDWLTGEVERDLAVMRWM